MFYFVCHIAFSDKTAKTPELPWNSWIHSPQHPDKPALPWNPNIIVRLKLKQGLKTYDDMYGHLQIL